MPSDPCVCEITNHCDGKAEELPRWRRDATHRAPLVPTPLNLWTPVLSVSMTQEATGFDGMRAEQVALRGDEAAFVKTQVALWLHSGATA